MSRLDDFQQTIGFQFRNSALLKEALTHRSYLNENPSWGVGNNERLEYLGDAVLELAVTEELFAQLPDESEGRLTALRAALVNYQMMAQVARAVGLEEHILLSKGEARDEGKAREVILANASEAIIGAMYLDQGYPAVKRFVVTWVLSRLGDVIARGLDRDPKSLLQERVQEAYRITPSYRVISEDGPDHQKQFVVGAYVGSELVGEGSGTSKQEAEVAAAERALTTFSPNHGQ